MITHQNLTIDPYYLQNPMAYQSYLQQQEAMRRAAQNQNMNQQPQRTQVQPLIPARMTSGATDFKPNEVPSDGTPACFLQGDYSCVYVRAVNTQGTIDTVRYVPEVIEKPKEEAQNNNQEDVIARLERIEKKLEQNNRSYYQKKPYYNKAKKNDQEAQNKKGE